MDRDALQALIGKWTAMTAHAYAVAVVALCDQAGILTAMKGRGMLTADEVAGASGTDPRMTAEALSTLAANDLIAHDDGRFGLSEEQAAVLADDTGPYFLASHAQTLRITLGAFGDLVAALQSGDGVPLDAYGPDLVANAGRLNAPSLRILLTRRWLPAVPGLVERLEQGIDVADVGCGTGAAAVAMARTYPASRVVGYDIDQRVLDRAQASAEGLGNVRFERRPANDLPEAAFDFILAFDVVHDLGQAGQALVAMRRALRPDGSMLMVEPNAGDDVDANRNPIGALFYGISTLYCLPGSMAQGDAGLGAAWGPARAEELAREAGFERFERLPVENPFQAFYLLS